MMTAAENLQFYLGLSESSQDEKEICEWLNREQFHANHLMHKMSFSKYKFLATVIEICTGD